MDWETSGRQGRREQPAEHTFWYVSRHRSAGRWIARWITVQVTLFSRSLPNEGYEQLPTLTSPAAKVTHLPFDSLATPPS